MSEQKQGFVSVRQVAEMLAVSTDTVRRMADNGTLRPYRFGRSVRFLREEIDTYIQRCAAVLVNHHQGEKPNHGGETE